MYMKNDRGTIKRIAIASNDAPGNVSTVAVNITPKTKLATNGAVQSITATKPNTLPYSSLPTILDRWERIPIDAVPPCGSIKIDKIIIEILNNILCYTLYCTIILVVVNSVRTFRTDRFLIVRARTNNNGLLVFDFEYCLWWVPVIDWELLEFCINYQKYYKSWLISRMNSKMYFNPNECKEFISTIFWNVWNQILFILSHK